MPAAERCLWSTERKTKLGTYHVSVDRPAPMSCMLDNPERDVKGAFRGEEAQRDKPWGRGNLLLHSQPRRRMKVHHVIAAWAASNASWRLLLSQSQFEACPSRLNLTSTLIFCQTLSDGSPTGGAGEGSAALQPSRRAENGDDRGATMCWWNKTRGVFEGECNDFYISLVVVLLKLIKFQDCLHLWPVRVCGPTIIVLSSCGSLLVLVSVCLLYHFSEESCCGAGFH